MRKTKKKKINEVEILYNSWGDRKLSFLKKIDFKKNSGTLFVSFSSKTYSDIGFILITEDSIEFEIEGGINIIIPSKIIREYLSEKL